MFNNLKAELVRINKTQGDLAKLLEITEKQVSLKINRHAEFTISECILIRNTYFPNLTLDYLFEVFEKEVKNASSD